MTSFLGRSHQYTFLMLLQPHALLGILLWYTFADLDISDIGLHLDQYFRALLVSPILYISGEYAI